MKSKFILSNQNLFIKSKFICEIILSVSYDYGEIVIYLFQLKFIY